MTCLHCGADISGKRKHAKWCSDKCRLAARYAADPEAARTKARRYYAANKETIAQKKQPYRAARYAANNVELRAKRVQHYAANREANKEKAQQWRAANPEKAREYQRKYLEKMKNNPKVTP